LNAGYVEIGSGFLNTEFEAATNEIPIVADDLRLIRLRIEGH